MKKEIIQKLEVYFGLSEDKNMELEIPVEAKSDFRKAIVLMKDFLAALHIQENDILKAKMNSWEDECQQSKAGGNAPQELNIENTPKPILEELFVPKTEYETLIQGQMRGNDLVILNPENGFEWKENKVSIKLLKKDMPKQVNFIIENNKGNEIKTGFTNLENQQFKIVIDIEKQLPGKYYLKLFTPDAFTIVSFYIQKGILN